MRPFSTKPALGGEAWEHFFEETPAFNSREEIFQYCENRPRDVLTYITYALEAAVAARSKANWRKRRAERAGQVQHQQTKGSGRRIR